MSVFTHGTSNGYSNHRCRCADCRAAWADYIRERSHRLGYHKPWAQYVVERRAASKGLVHGTETGYTWHRCRCDECREASRAARKARRQKDVAA